jgi:hypothetical protein
VETTASAAGSRALCLRLQRGGGVRGWGRDGLGTGRRGEGAEGVDVDHAHARRLVEDVGAVPGADRHAARYGLTRTHRSPKRQALPEASPGNVSGSVTELTTYWSLVH